MGNVLMGDDGFGPTVVRTLEAAYDVPPEVQLLDVGTPGLDLVPYIAGTRALVVVDTVRSEGPPGALRLDRKDEILRHAGKRLRLGPHDPGLEACLQGLDLAGLAPADVLLVGAIPCSSRHAEGLSEPLRAAVPGAIVQVLAELASLGAPAVPRREPATPDLWWERPVPA